MKKHLRWALACVFLLGAVASGCSSSDSKSETALSACQDFCVAEKDCDTTTTVEECIEYACGDIEKQKTACQSALKAFYDCMKKASDVCSTASCETQEVAYHEACSD
ncbi:MAG: hypothetical protein ACOY0T_12540 [Myxococcota bacterium]